MKIDAQRAIDRWAGVPICALLSLAERLLPRRTPAVPPRNVLVVLLSEMGSLVLAQPMFARLKERYPGVALHILLLGKNREVVEMLGVVPPDNIVAIDDGSLASFARDSLSALRRLRAIGIDAVIDCELFARISAIFSYLSGAPVRVGFDRHTQEGLYRGTLVNRPVLYNPYRHMSLQFLTLADAIESSSSPIGKDEAAAPSLLESPMLDLAQGELDEVAARLSAEFPAIAGRPLALVYPGGGVLPVRAWPLAHYQALATSLLADGYAVAAIGLPADRADGDAIVAHCASPFCVNLAGWTRSVRELVALFRHAALLVTNDGGPAQFSPLARIPTVALFGPETPALYAPLGGRVECLHRALPCSPCLTAYNHRRTPCDGDNQCLKRIPPDEVLARARAIARPPHSSAPGASA
jgi:lipopolysaccharide heptosyltransferase II